MFSENQGSSVYQKLKIMSFNNDAPVQRVED
jgi:hypothetical protein